MSASCRDVSTHSRLRPQAGSSSAEKSLPVCPLSGGRGYLNCRDGRLSYRQRLLRLLCVVIAAGFLHGRAPADAAGAAAGYREVEWTELVPSSWHPEKLFEGLNLDELADNDPRAVKALEALEAEWRNAPINPDLKGLRIKIPGYVAPLDWESEDRLKEFLLVPYFGACIHVPPPPANQIIYIAMNKELAGIRSMDTVWVYGVLDVEKHDSGAMGAAGYSMRPDKVELYE